MAVSALNLFPPLSPHPSPITLKPTIYREYSLCLGKFSESSLLSPLGPRPSPAELWLVCWAQEVWAEMSGSCTAWVSGWTEGGHRSGGTEHSVGVGASGRMTQTSR